MERRIHLWWLLLMSFGMRAVVAQDTNSLTLDQAIDRALQNNRQVRINQYKEEEAIHRYRETQAMFLPRVSVSYTGMVTNQPLQSFGFKLQQQRIGAADFSPDELNHPASTENFNTLLSVQQPLLNIDQVFHRKAARQQLEAQVYQKQAVKEGLVRDVRQAYFQLSLAHHAVGVMDEALQTAETLLDQTRQRYDRGFLQKSDLLNAQVHVTHMRSQLQVAESNVALASDQLSLLMGLPVGSIYLTDSLDKHLIVVPALTVPASRADLKAMHAMLAAQEHVVKAQKGSKIPRVNAFAEYGMNDQDPFGFGAGAYLVGARLSWDVFNGTSTQNRISTQEIARNRMSEEIAFQLERDQLELSRLYRKAKDAQATLTYQEASVAQATEALRILQNRFEEGLSSVSDLMQSQHQLSVEKLHHAETLFDLHATLTQLEYLTNATQLNEN